MNKVTVKDLLAHKLRLALTCPGHSPRGDVRRWDLRAHRHPPQHLHHPGRPGLSQRLFRRPGPGRFSGAAGAGGASTADRKPVPAAVAAAVRRVPGVAYVDPSVEGYAQFVTPDGNAIGNGGASTLGFSFDPDRQLSSVRLVEGRAPEGPMTW